jgi:hypothetical protein
MRAWACRAFGTGLLACVLIAASHVVGFLRGLPTSYARSSHLGLLERQRLLHEDGFMDLLEASRRAFPEPRTVAVWIPEFHPDALSDLARLGERWIKAAYYLYPHQVVPLAPAWTLVRLAASGVIDPTLPPLLQERYLPLETAQEPLSILAFQPRYPDRLESVLVEETDLTEGREVNVGSALDRIIPIPLTEVWLSSVDLMIEGWTEEETLRLSVWDGAAHRSLLGEVVRRGPTPKSPERFRFSPPVPLGSGQRRLLEISHLGGGDGSVRVRSRSGGPWLRAFVVEPAARPLVIERLGTLFFVSGRKGSS